MIYLLDTCVLSELTRPKPERAVLRWLEALDDSAVVISVLTLGELERGVGKLPTGARKRALAAWLEEIEGAYATRILDITAAVASEWGRLCARSERQGVTMPVIDSLIGATALVHQLTVATRNLADLNRTGARTFNPWP